MRKFGEKAGKVGQNVQGDLAAMRGAAYYGIDGVKRPEQTDIAEFPYKDETFVPENYDTVICIGNYIMFLSEPSTKAFCLQMSGTITLLVLTSI